MSQTVVEWFYNPLKGQPRYTDITKLRQLSKTENISLKVSALIGATLSKPYRIEGRQAKEFFSKMDFHCELWSFSDDLVVLDAGVFVKLFSAESYNRLEDGRYELKPIGKRKLVGLCARDGGSFLKEIDVNGVVYRYWQYSYLHPQVAPVEFDVDEIAYCERHPRSYSCYGWSELESLQTPKGILRRILHREPKVFELNPETVAQLRKTIEATMNRQIMPEFGKHAHFKF